MGLDLINFFAITLDRNVSVIFKLGLGFVDYGFRAQHWAHHFGIIGVGFWLQLFGITPDRVICDGWFGLTVRSLVDDLCTLFPVGDLLECLHTGAHGDLVCMRVLILANFSLEKFFFHNVRLQWHPFKFRQRLSGDFERVCETF